MAAGLCAGAGGGPRRSRGRAPSRSRRAERTHLVPRSSMVAPLHRLSTALALVAISLPLLLLPAPAVGSRCFLRTDVVLTDCGHSAAAHTFTRDSAGRWTDHPHANCFAGHGATSLTGNLGDNYTVAACQAACTAYAEADCTAVAVLDSSPLPPPLPPLPPPGPPAQPSADQLAWLDLEVGTFFHYTMYTFVSQPNNVSGPHEDCGQVFNSNLDQMPPPSTFNPTQLNIDQWMLASKAMNAKYAILVAKHGDGFINFPTNATFRSGEPYNYGVQQSSWLAGKGDLVREFVTSARKHGLSPGLYYSLGDNYYLSIGANQTAAGFPIPNTTKGQHPVRTRDEYLQIVYTQLSELWGRYGQLGELWFDGALPFSNDRAMRQQIAEMAARLQPHAILLDGPSAKNAARKGNGETCTVHNPNWYSCPEPTAGQPCSMKSPYPLGGVGNFIPAEGEGCAVGDGKSRQWFWHPDHDAHAALKTVQMFVDEYHNRSFSHPTCLPIHLPAHTYTVSALYC